MRGFEFCQSTRAQPCDGLLWRWCARSREGVVPLPRPCYPADTMICYLGSAHVALIPSESTQKECPMNIYVGNFAFTATEAEVRQLFDAYGTVDTVRVMTDRETRQPRGLALSRCPTLGRPRPRSPA